MALRPDEITEGKNIEKEKKQGFKHENPGERADEGVVQEAGEAGRESCQRNQEKRAFQEEVAHH